LKVKGTNKAIRFLTTFEVIFRFITFFLRKNKYFDENGKLKEGLIDE
jgi:hypothetical protein